MKILSLNCQRVNNSLIANALQVIVKHNPLEVVFLYEIKALTNRIHLVVGRLGFLRSFVINLVNGRSGMALFWNDDLNIIILQYTTHFIHMKLKDDFRV